ncbi:MAG TPA: diaminopimelate epimerase [Candidatus Limnocylindrales bacterium]|nr:diaminopimelate epimerase [Candidatus Limnocylindrales bacterium]
MNVKNIFDSRYPVTKMHGTGNDFLVYVDLNGETTLEDVRKICASHIGVGADALITITESRDAEASYRMKYFNSDGSFAEMCGNGIRCFVKYLIDNELVSVKDKITVDTDRGNIIAEVIRNSVKEGIVKVNMGIPVFEDSKHTLLPVNNNGSVKFTVSVVNSKDKRIVKLRGIYISMGNPHAIFFVKKGQGDEFSKEYGPQIEKNIKLFPEGTNVEFVEVNNKKDLTVNVWERAVGITLSCGTGACAAFVASVLNNYVGDLANVNLPGGSLTISWEGIDKPVFMTGPAVNVFNVNSLDKFLLKE